MMIAPEGWYRVRVEDTHIGRSKTGNSILRVLLETDEGQIFSTLSFLPQASWRISNLLKITKTPFQISGANISFDTDDLIGKEMMIHLVHEEYHGRIYLKVAIEAEIGDRILEKREESTIDQIALLRLSFPGIDEASLQQLLVALK